MCEYLILVAALPTGILSRWPKEHADLYRRRAESRHRTSAGCVRGTVKR